MTPSVLSDLDARVALLPCPFCGGAAGRDTTAASGDFWIICEVCEAQSAIFDTLTEAIAAWNTRADTSVIAAMRGALDAVTAERNRLVDELSYADLRASGGIQGD